MEKIINRLNEIARKLKETGELSPEELKEREDLRNLYRKNFKANFVNIMEGVHIEELDGTVNKVERNPKK